MAYPWEYFEKLDQVVYVADPETYELVYLNAYARNLLKVEGDSYKGKPCHAVLQGLTRPCPFCTNFQLEDGKFLSWSYRNPVVNTIFRIDDTIIVYEGKRYRLEFADPQDRDPEAVGYNAYVHYETIVNECLMTIHSTSDQNEALRRMLEYLGPNLNCESILLYECRIEPWVTATYAWTKSGKTVSQEPVKIGYKFLEPWIKRMAYNEPILIRDMKTLCDSNPGLCEFLGGDTAERMIVAPLVENQKLVGFLRVDDPKADQMDVIAAVCRILSYYILSVLRQRDLIGALEMTSCHDQLTGALNRHAFHESMNEPELLYDTGLIYCDVVGLKGVNDQLGHTSGDHLLLRVYHLLCGVFHKEQIYRIGGDEFLVVCRDKGEAVFQEKVGQLRVEAVDQECELSIGSVWAPVGSGSFQQLLEQADMRMYEDKKRQYAEMRRPAAAGRQQDQKDTRLQSFLRNYHFDIDTFFQSVAAADASIYLYCGDLQKNVYYISDNLREEFGFPDNLIYDFVERLEALIYEPDREFHEADVREMYAEKREEHFIRYRIHDRNGDLVWMRCHGIMKWDEEKKRPLFFSGSMMKLKNEAEIDPVTGLMHISYAIRKLPVFHNWNVEMTLLCIICQNFSDINRTFGRDTGDMVLLEASTQLERQLGEQMQIFRMDGARFLAVTREGADTHRLASEVQRIVKSIYHKYGIELMYPCAIGVLRSSGGAQVPQTLVDHAGVAAHIAKAYPGLDYLEFSSQMLETYQDRSDLNLSLNSSVNHNFEGFRIVVQPQVRAEDGYIFGGEVLLRWQMGEQAVSPVKFIPVLEQTGLILPVGKWVLEQAIQAAKRILKYRPDFLVSVNVSYLQIMDRTLFESILALLQKYEVPPYNLLLELTESHFDEMPDYLERFVRQCHKVGIRFALDDFGNAYSFLQLLLQYPADLVKLDRSLMQEITLSEEKQNFMQSIIYACHKFGKQVCIEGVETKEELQVVRQMHCDFIQGFYFYRPTELQDLYPLLEKAAQVREERN